MIMYLLTLALFGLIVGAIARLLVPGPTPMGVLGTMAAGIAGAFLGGLVGKLLWGANYAPGWIMSILGALLVVWAVSRRRVYY
ncbi:MAG: GlsB/YeaQ/YmgE family stress response membrane protein [Acidimicrobiales bacterium]